MRIGQGYDAHRLVPGRRLVLAGVEIPFERGLEGHSDADVVAHAIMDAILGALVLGDLGAIFPPGDPDYKDADSMELLRQVADMARERGLSVAQVDVTIIADAPRVAPFVERMRRLSDTLGRSEREALPERHISELPSVSNSFCSRCW